MHAWSQSWLAGSWASYWLALLLEDCSVPSRCTTRVIIVYVDKPKKRFTRRPVLIEKADTIDANANAEERKDKSDNSLTLI